VRRENGLRKPLEGNFPEIGPDDEVSSEVVPHNDATNERSLARRLALQVLYEIDSTGHKLGTVMTAHLDNLPTPPPMRTVRYMHRLVMGVIENRKTRDISIQPYAPEWPLDQVAIVDRNILRLAVFEFGTQIVPVGVAIDEAVELAKLFGADNSPRFINGVLGALADDKTMVDKLAGMIVDKGEDGEQAE
jgi:transcription antitermination protein NusB